MNVTEKRAEVEKLTAQIRAAESMIVTDYRGLSVGQLADVRNQLREAGASLTVAKNTLARIAAGQAEKPDLVSLLQGPTAIAFVSDDPAAAAKKLSEIARQTRILQVRGAIIEGETLSAERGSRAGRPASPRRAPSTGGRGYRLAAARRLQHARSAGQGVSGGARPVHRKATGGRGRLDRRHHGCYS